MSFNYRNALQSFMLSMAIFYVEHVESFESHMAYLLEHINIAVRSKEYAFILDELNVRKKSGQKNHNVTQKLNSVWKQCLCETGQSEKADGETQSNYVCKFLFFSN